MNPGRKILLALLQLYKLIVSPALHVIAGPMGGCRFHPTCSVYAAEAVALHGVLKGTWLTVRRLCRCHPWGGCGDDPVPPNFRTSGTLLTPATSSHSCCTHVTMQHAAHFGCPPPAH